MHKRLGFYVLAVATGQFVLYTAALWGGERVDWLFSLDPRIGLFSVETMIRTHESFPGLLSWGSAVVLAVTGVALTRNPSVLKMYLCVEGVMVIPSAMFFLLVILGNLSPAHGFSIGELIIPVPIFLVASVAPFRWGYRSCFSMTVAKSDPASPTSARSE